MTVGVGLVGCGSIGQIHAVGLAQLVEDGEIRALIAVDPSPEARTAADRNCHFGELSSELEAAVSHAEVARRVVAGPTVTHPRGGASRHRIEEGGPLREAARHRFPCRSSGWWPMSRHPASWPRWGSIRASTRCSSGCASWSTAASYGAPLGYVLREDQFWPTGSVVAGHSSWRSDPQQAGGGALLEHTIHGCDLLVHLFGPATSVSARTRSVFGFGVEDIATAQVEHVDGTIGTITTVFNGVVGREERRLEVFFEQATVETTGDFIIGAPEDSMAIHRPGRSGGAARSRQTPTLALRRCRGAEDGPSLLPVPGRPVLRTGGASRTTGQPWVRRRLERPCSGRRRLPIGLRRGRSGRCGQKAQHDLTAGTGGRLGATVGAVEPSLACLADRGEGARRCRKSIACGRARRSGPRVCHRTASGDRRHARRHRRGGQRRRPGRHRRRRSHTTRPSAPPTSFPRPSCVRTRPRRSWPS